MRDDAPNSQPDILLSPNEVAQITGYRRHAQQLEELHRQGFWRARRAPVTGRVILERAHYEAVCAGMTGSNFRLKPQPEPQLSPGDPTPRPRLRTKR